MVIGWGGKVWVNELKQRNRHDSTSITLSPLTLLLELWSHGALSTLSSHMTDKKAQGTARTLLWTFPLPKGLVPSTKGKAGNYKPRLLITSPESDCLSWNPCSQTPCLSDLTLRSFSLASHGEIKRAYPMKPLWEMKKKKRCRWRKAISSNPMVYISPVHGKLYKYWLEGC